MINKYYLGVCNDYDPTNQGGGWGPPGNFGGPPQGGPPQGNWGWYYI